MYLLIQVQTFLPFCLFAFTFHNVSINSEINTLAENLFNDFTFHNVSINSGNEIRNASSFFNLYIP